MGRPSHKPNTHFLPSPLENLLVFLLIFTIPANLSFGLFKDTASVNGILIDYLIPKLYLSDIIIGMLIIVWLTRLNWLQLLSKLTSAKPFTSPLFITALAFISILFLSATASPKPIASYWYLAKIIQVIILGAWFSSHTLDLTKPITLTLIFQSAVALIQWIQKKSLLGYLFLGETTLKATSQIAQTGITGEIRPLPYGTTPHPNILAGLITIYLLVFFLHRSKHPPTPKLPILEDPPNYLKSPLTYALILAPITLVLTQSLSAILALVIGLYLLYSKHLPAKLRHLPIVLTLIATLAVLRHLPPESITRRTQLATISFGVITHLPVLGAGPNNFTAVMSQYGDVPGTTRFIQPVHNIYLLTASEIGLIGTALLLLLLYRLKPHLPQIPPSQAAPLAALLFIGLLDHYPLTLQTGQLLLALTLGFTFSTSPPPQHSPTNHEQPTAARWHPITDD